MILRVSILAWMQLTVFSWLDSSCIYDQLTRQLCFWLLAGWPSAGAMRATGPCVFQHAANQCSLTSMVAGQRKGGELERKHTRYPAVSVLNQHTIASATFCYLKESHKASPRSQRAEKLYLFVGGAIMQGEWEELCSFFTFYLNLYFKKVISNGISLLKMKLHVDIWNENCDLSLSFIRTAGQCGGMKIGFQKSEKLYIHFKIS